MKPLLTQLLVLVASAAITLPAHASPIYWSSTSGRQHGPKIDASLTVGYDSHFNFNGITYGKEVFWSGLDVEFPLTDSLFLSFNATYWDVGSPADDFDREFDHSVALTHELDPNTWVSLVYTRYTFFGDIPTEPELGVAIEHTWRRIDFALWYGFDFESSGHYFEANASRPFHVNELLSIVPSVQLSYLAGYPESPSGLNHIGLRLDFPLDFTEKVSVVPYVAAAIPMSALKGSGYTDREFYGGVVLRIRF